MIPRPSGRGQPVLMLLQAASLEHVNYAPTTQRSGLGLLWVFHDTSTALKPNYQSFRLLKFEILEIMGGLCCCPHGYCHNHGTVPSLGPGIKGSGSSQRPLGIILENKEWWSSSAFLYLHRAYSVTSGACYARSCIWALSQRQMYS